jgi:hypothetical protein
VAKIASIHAGCGSECGIMRRASALPLDARPRAISTRLLAPQGERANPRSKGEDDE